MKLFAAMTIYMGFGMIAMPVWWTKSDAYQLLAFPLWYADVVLLWVLFLKLGWLEDKPCAAV